MNNRTTSNGHAENVNLMKLDYEFNRCATHIHSKFIICNTLQMKGDERCEMMKNVGTVIKPTRA